MQRSAENHLGQSRHIPLNGGQLLSGGTPEPCSSELNQTTSACTVYMASLTSLSGAL